MSMPSSSELVATTAGSSARLELGLGAGALRAAHRPVVRARQDRRRRRRVSTPTAVPGLRRDGRGAAARRGPARRAPWRSAHTSFMRAVRRSAPRRELVKTSVDRCSATRSTTRSSTCGQIDGRTAAGPAPAPDRSRRRRRRRVGAAAGPQVGDGDDDVDLDLLGRRRLHDAHGPPAVRRRARAAEELGDRRRRAGRSRTARCAAPGPGRPGGRAARRAARGDSARCAPRLVPATAWISSMITVRTPASPARAPDVRTRYSDSGVVMRMSGGRRRERAALARGRVARADADRDVRQLGPEARRRLPDADQR